MEKNKNYLVSFYNKKKDKRIVNEIKVLESTTTCYKIEFISDSSFFRSEVEWIEKSDFDNEYVVLESIERDSTQNIFSSQELFEEEEIIKSYHIPPLPQPPPPRILKEGEKPPKPPYVI